MNQAKNQHALITGASKGIGAAITRTLLQQGYQVTGIAREYDSEFLQSDQFSAQTLDLSELDSLPAAFCQIRKSLQSLDVLICNAGYGRFAALEEFSAAQIRRLIDVNLTSHLLLLREMVPVMKRQRSGHIILLGSEAALQGARKASVYAASKFALRGVAQSLREECAASGIGVTIINPGMVNTRFFDELNFRPGDAGDCHLLADDVAEVVLNILQSRVGANIDEINMAAQKKVIAFEK